MNEMIFRSFCIVLPVIIISVREWKRIRAERLGEAEQKKIFSTFAQVTKTSSHVKWYCLRIAVPHDLMQSVFGETKFVFNYLRSKGCIYSNVFRVIKQCPEQSKSKEKFWTILGIVENRNGCYNTFFRRRRMDYTKIRRHGRCCIRRQYTTGYFQFLKEKSGIIYLNFLKYACRAFSRSKGRNDCRKRCNIWNYQRLRCKNDANLFYAKGIMVIMGLLAEIRGAYGTV